jgi:acyl carrier protein
MEVDVKFEQQVITLITGAIPGKFKKVKIARETHLQKELGLDSIGILALVFRFEEMFQVDLAEMGIDIDVAKLKRVEDLLVAAREIMKNAAAKES